ncbi:hypothetical protein N9H60_03730 [Flavimaricola sp.]|nr:hypothetical protein [Flavimaricola sp.]
MQKQPTAHALKGPKSSFRSCERLSRRHISPARSGHCYLSPDAKSLSHESILSPTAFYGRVVNKGRIGGFLRECCLFIVLLPGSHAVLPDGIGSGDTTGQDFGYQTEM